MEFKLPQLGNKLFISGNYDSMSYIGTKKPLEHLDLFAIGYKGAADELAEKSASSHSNLTKDSLVYPVIFLYRHYLELRLKQMYLRFTDNPDTKNLNHNLLITWEKTKPIIEKANLGVEKEELRKTLQATENYIKQFGKKDLDSYVYRYPFAKSKKKQEDLKSYFDGEVRIDLLHLKERMNELENLFFGTIAQLEYIDEVKQMYIDESRE
ncbi:hypothetical protein [Priestia megaterium]|uniref:hypothetical protein n=1 Tax=Priestia megaterium TaxID=1404 RepID=UPI00244726CA|nr:hypothetical protein [Priestia megaterium]MDH2363774.1 hypothetical protein [Priestia megaterium]